MAAPTGRGLCCVRCGATVYDGGELTEEVAAVDATSAKPPVVPEYWAWQVNEQLRHAERVTQSGRRRKTSMGEQIRIDDASPTVPPTRDTSRETKRSDAVETPLGAFAWFVICAGVTALTCGSVLMVWSIYGERPELWTVGLPIMIVGQVTLVLGVGLQLVARTQLEQRTTQQPAAEGSHAPSRESSRQDEELRPKR